MKISTFLQNALLNASLRNTSFTLPTSVYVGLHTADPTDSTATALSNEVSGNAYVRQAATFGIPSGGSTSTTVDITFPQASPSGWGTVTYISIWDLSSSGNLLYHSAISPSITVNATGDVKILSGNLTVQLT